MILIFAAKALGGSRYPVPGAPALFESMLGKDDRLNEWVISFVAEAIEMYPVDMPEGDKLMDLLEEKLALLRSATGPPGEYYGFHFLPPPKGDLIRLYIAGIENRALRVSERKYYYLLVDEGYTEERIEKALRRLQSQGVSAGDVPPAGFLKYLYSNRERIP